MTNRIFSLVFWLGVVLVVAALAIRLGVPAQNEYANYLAWGGIACMVLYSLTQWREVAEIFSHRRARYGTLAATSTFVVLGILVAINLIGQRQNRRWDLTAAQQYSLSDQSRNVLAKLDAPMQVSVFAEESRFPEFRDRLREYEYASSQLTTEYVDPDRRPAAAQQAGVQQYGTILVSYKGRSERTTMNTEQDITNTIIKVITGQQKKVLFTQGHDERDPTSGDREGYSAVAEKLKLENYTVERFVLAQQGAVPEDASAVVVAGPRTDFLAPEIEALEKYLGQAGKLLLLLDPPEGAGAAPLPNLVGLARKWGIEVGNDIVVDVSGMGRLFGASEAMPVVASYPSHSITDRFDVMTLFPLTRSVSPVSGGTDGRVGQSFIETGAASWSETDLEALFASQPAEADETTGDKKGPISIAVAVTGSGAAESASTEAAAEKTGADPTAPKPQARVIVVGDSDFPANSYLGFQGNGDLFMNTIGWLTQQENLIAIRPRDAADRRLSLTATQTYIVSLLALVVVPGVVFGTGVYSWWRRR
jgi:ABC-type uncharacterized transport system involved in gliding motility auxiliary subunit